MNYLKVAFQLAKIIVAVIISLLYSSCINTALVANQPTLTDFQLERNGFGNIREQPLKAKSVQKEKTQKKLLLKMVY